MIAQLKPSEGFEYYTGAVYWNNFEQIVERQNLQVSGDSGKGWTQCMLESWGGRRERGLFISCGNGWVERDCFKAGLIKSAFGFDVMPELVERARAGAAEIGMVATYVVADGNELSLPERDFDIIVNLGSMHHIAYIDKLTRQLRTLLAPDGVYVIAGDYTGAHRNQYDWPTWSRIVEVHSKLPPRYRIELQYPHMPTMLVMDPTEAVHSELQMDVARRYFDILQENRFGGGVAYTLMFENRQLFADRNTDEGRAVVAMLLEEDARLLAEHPMSNLFTFAICRPKQEVGDEGTLQRWAEEEEEREEAARHKGGRYYPASPLELIYNELSDARYENKILRGQINARFPQRIGRKIRAMLRS